MEGERVRCALDPLVNVRIRPEGPAELALRLAGSDIEILDATRGLQLRVNVIERLGAVDLEARRPEVVLNLDGGQR
jgi:hypothetical protein